MKNAYCATRDVCGDVERAILELLEEKHLKQESISNSEVLRYLSSSNIWKENSSQESKEASSKRATSSLKKKGYLQKNPSGLKTGANNLAITDAGMKYLNKNISVSWCSLHSDEEAISIDPNFCKTDNLLDFQVLAQEVNRKAIQILEKNENGGKILTAASFFYFSEMKANEIPSFLMITENKLNDLIKKFGEVFFKGRLSEELCSLCKNPTKELSKVFLPINSAYPDDMEKYFSSIETFTSCELGFKFFLPEMLGSLYLDSKNELQKYCDVIIQVVESSEKLKSQERKNIIRLYDNTKELFSRNIMESSPFSTN